MIHGLALIGFAMLCRQEAAPLRAAHPFAELRLARPLTNLE